MDACAEVAIREECVVLRPKISTNLAISADGKISNTAGISSGWTSREDHARLLELRGNADALLVGRGTLESDRMTLTVPGKSTQPLCCVVSRNGVFQQDHPLFKTAGGEIHLLVTGEKMLQSDLEISAAIVHQMSLADFLETLTTQYGVKHLHCEGGGDLVHELAAMDVIDEFHLTLAAHSLFGGQSARTATGIPGNFLPASRHFEICHFEPREDLGECFLSYRRTRQ
jgi:2,5-diamino-6-(ribosylamino)-4(3H)-pyrimidinone 5'-phosphate reductase